MTDSLSPHNNARLQEYNTNDDNWGDPNLNEIFQKLDDNINGFETVSLTGDKTFTNPNYIQNEFVQAGYKFTDGGMSAAASVTFPSTEFVKVAYNATGYTLTLKLSGDTGITLTAGTLAVISSDGTNVRLVAGTTMGGGRLQNLGTPTATTDATTKQYVDNLIAAVQAAIGSPNDNDWGDLTGGSGSEAYQRRRGTTAENDAFTGLVGEVVVDTDKSTLRVQDGVTAGGHEVAKADLSNISEIDGEITISGSSGSLVDFDVPLEGWRRTFEDNGGSRTLDLTDVGCDILFSNASGFSITFPGDAPIGAEIDFCIGGTGGMSLVGASGDVLVSSLTQDTISTATFTQYSEGRAKKRKENEIWIAGIHS